jgi:hypothetical protein
MIDYVTTSGDFEVKEGGLSGTWTDELPSGAVTGYVSGDNIGVLTSSGTFEVKQGSLTNP